MLYILNEGQEFSLCFRNEEVQRAFKLKITRSKAYKLESPMAKLRQVKRGVMGISLLVSSKPKVLQRKQSEVLCLLQRLLQVVKATSTRMMLLEGT